MSSDKATATASGVGFCGLLTIAFVVLKLTNVIDWSWWWVISPVLIQLSIAILMIIVGAIGLKILNKKSRR